MSCRVCGCKLYPCRCDLPDPRDFFKYGEMFVEIELPQSRFDEELVRSRYEVLRYRVEYGGMSDASASQLIHDHVREGRITPDQGADLLELRRHLRWKRRPWWERAIITIWRTIWG